jgi:tetratricopeptide (TPR) repeat protein
VVDCLTEVEVIGLLAGTPSPHAAARCAAHRARCDACRTLVATLLEGSSVAPGTIGPDGEGGPHADPTATGPTGDGRGASARGLAPGTRVGRYVVLEVIGHGAMGVVHAAYDPQLDRKVALELRRDGSGGDPEAGAHGAAAVTRVRLLREAQHMARLSHANVLAVHDAGLFGGDMFVAVDFVDGVTLADWLLARRRPWRDVVDVFAAAGAGLAAIHAAGVVHGDFTPSNVLVAHDGRVLVSDFGLSGRRTQHAPSADPEAGTPACMAPEQHRGEPAGPASDQFDFCAALYQGLYGARPFAGDTREALAAEVLAGNVREPRGGAVPAWVRQLVLRGLRPAPDDRHASMAELAAALRHRPDHARRGAVIVAGAVAAIACAAATAGVFGASDTPAPCAGGPDQLAEVWNADRRAQLVAAFSAIGAPYAADSAARVAAVIEGYRAAWIEAYEEACRATRVHHAQPEATLDVRMRCLRRCADELASLVQELSRADASALPRAVPAAYALADPARCADLVGDDEVAVPPAERVRAVEAARSRLAEAKSLIELGDATRAVDISSAAAETARELGYRPLEAEALSLLGVAQQNAGDPRAAAVTLERATLAALASGHGEELAYAAATLTAVLAHELADLPAAHRAERLAASALERAPARDDLAVRLHRARGVLLGAEGKYRDAIAEHERAVAIVVRLHGPDHYDAATLVNNIGAYHHDLGDVAAAAEHHRRALAILERAVGPDHPIVMKPLTGLALDLAAMRELDQAKALLERTVAIGERALGPDHIDLAGALRNLGTVALHRGELRDAARMLERAAAIEERAVGESRGLATTLHVLGAAYGDLGDTARGLSVCRRALAMMERIVGGDHPDLVHYVGTLARLHAQRGELARAVPLYRRALALVERAAPGHPIILPLLAQLGDAHLRRGDPRRAIPVLERALELARAESRGHASAAFALARALRAAGRDRRAIALARAARRTCEGEDPLCEPVERADIDAWLAR